MRVRIAEHGAGEPDIEERNRVELNGVDRLVALERIAALQAEFTHRLDRAAGRGVGDLFTPSGRYVIDGVPLIGPDAISSAYAARESAGPRTARHLFVNGRVESLDADECRCTSVLVLYAADGEPVLPLPSPLSISDVEDHLVRTADGWRFQSRELVAVFRGEGRIVSPQSAVRPCLSSAVKGTESA